MVTDILSLEEFDKHIMDEGEIHGKKHIIIDFYATWCGPCKRFAPEFVSLSEEYADIHFIKVNIEEVD